MNYRVLILQEAEEDLFDIYRCILENDSRQSAQFVLERFEATISSLDALPEHGHVPPELARIGVTGILRFTAKRTVLSMR